MGVALVLLGMVGVLLALWVLIVGHLRWARIDSRKGSAVLGVGSLVLLVAGSLIGAPASPAPRAGTTAASTGSTPSGARPSPAPSSPASAGSSPTPPAVTTPAHHVPTTSPRASSPATPRPPAGSALVALLALAVKGRAPKTGYSREDFGPAWADVAHDGCDTRNDVLRRDLTAVIVSAGTGGCEVLTGSLADPYSGTTIAFTRGVSTSAEVQIDHVVPLSNAWQTGAAGWTATTREDFANDPLNLLAVDGSLNEQKSDGDAATWLPPNKPDRCNYVARQVAVKARYKLWVTPPEEAAIARILAGCSGQGLVTEAAATPPAPNSNTPVGHESSSPRSTASARATAQPAGLDPRFPSCRAAKAAGYGPYRKGIDPEYFWYIDGDHDGIDCE